MTPARPAHPLSALTTYELAGDRRELEHSLAVIPATAPVRALLQTRLAQLADAEPAPPGPAVSPARCRGYLGRGPT